VWVGEDSPGYVFKQRQAGRQAGRQARVDFAH
jgi:hypothetical protein